MAMQQQPNQSETKVPFFCEWIFEKTSRSDEKGGLSIFDFMFKIDSNEGVYIDYLRTPYYYLNGFPGIKYYMDLKMNDIDEDEKELSLDFNIEMDYKNFNIDADYKFTIPHYEPVNIVENINHIQHNKGFSCTRIYECQTSSLLYECEEQGCPLHLVKKIVIHVEGTFTIKHVDTLPIEIKVSKKEKRLYEKNDNKDFGIVAEELEIRVHKSLLIQNSTVFATMFESNNWKETMENRMVIPDFNFKVVEIAINALYGKIYDQPLEKEQYLKLFQFADKYDMEKLKAAVEKNIVITPSNVVVYANYFLQNYCDQLVNRSIDYILSCSQYSIPIKDIELLDMQIRGMFFDRTLVNPVFKKDLKTENRCHNDESENYSIKKW